MACHWWLVMDEWQYGMHACVYARMQLRMHDVQSSAVGAAFFRMACIHVGWHSSAFGLHPPLTHTPFEPKPFSFIPPTACSCFTIMKFAKAAGGVNGSSQVVPSFLPQPACPMCTVEYACKQAAPDPSLRKLPARQAMLSAPPPGQMGNASDYLGG